MRAACTTSRLGRSLARSFWAEYVERVRAYQGTPAYEKALRKRSVWVEPLFGEAKDGHGLRRFRLRRLPKVNTEALLTAAAGGPPGSAGTPPGRRRARPNRPPLGAARSRAGLAVGRAVRRAGQGASRCHTR